MKQILKVDGMPPSLTKYRNMHYQELNNEKRAWERAVGYLVKEQKLKPMQRIDMTYEFFFQTKVEHDPDNYACCAKFINDGLVGAGILPRDNFNIIRELRIRQGGLSKKPYILVHMEEIA